MSFRWPPESAEVLEIDPSNLDALAIKGQINGSAARSQIDNWFRLAQQHLENQLLRPVAAGGRKDFESGCLEPQARAFFPRSIARKEEASKIREEKQKLYEAALASYKNGAITTALSKLEQVLDLRPQLSVQSSNRRAVSGLYNQIRSEREEIHNGYAEGRKALDDRNFDRALQICNE